LVLENFFFGKKKTEISWVIFTSIDKEGKEGEEEEGKEQGKT
jgi:hypothetical protein